VVTAAAVVTTAAAVVTTAAAAVTAAAASAVTAHVSSASAPSRFRGYAIVFRCRTAGRLHHGLDPAMALASDPSGLRLDCGAAS
jgi:hypothetical protein